MSTPPNSEEFYEKLKEQLYDTHVWPQNIYINLLYSQIQRKIAEN